MPVKTSIAAGHSDLLKQIRRFVTGHGMRGTDSYVGTGNGTIGEVNVGNATTVEVWTIACVDVTTVGSEVWTVTGSVTGLLTLNAVTGVKYDEGIVEFLITAGGTNFALTDAFTIKDNVYTGTGDGTIGTVEMGKDNIDETWTIKVTSIAGGAGNETWSVVGSTTGALANATTAVAYVTDHINFTITAGGVAFAVNDQFVYKSYESVMTGLSRAWIEDKWTGTALYLQGVGLDGLKEIYVGIREYENVGNDYYNFAIMGATGHVGGSAFASQPGASGERYIPLWNGSIPYKLYCNGQRIMLHAKIETNFLGFYLGFIIPYATPTQVPYPLVVSGSSALSNTRYSSGVVSFFQTLQPKFRDISGTWILLEVWPHGGHTGTDAGTSNRVRDTIKKRRIRTVAGEYPVFASVCLEHITTWSTTPDETGQIHGELDGVVFITGFNNAVENTLDDNVSGKTYFITRASSSTGLQAYAGLEEA
ncbi:MAG: hypothetical protein GQ468_05345 [Candidatus Scalindua sp.]|nr:hypothetical protein [Candidatus Scalindua sp.]